LHNSFVVVTLNDPADKVGLTPNSVLTAAVISASEMAGAAMCKGVVNAAILPGTPAAAYELHVINKSNA
jgi:hypothetical protein